MNKKIITKTFLIFFVNFLCISQVKLSNSNTTWSIVMPGISLCEPALTSYGFAILTDANSISGISENGKILWEKQIKRTRNSFLTSLPHDFLVLVKDKKTITLFNTSGNELWSKQSDFDVSQITPGFDGRFFSSGENGICCHSINGIVKWKIDFSDKKLSQNKIVTLKDGSILLIFKKTENGKSKGIRVSPYGKILEEITFSGEILTSNECENGILLTFSDGSSGMFFLNQNNLSENRWTLEKKSKNPKNSFFLVSEDLKSVFYLNSNEKFLEINSINIENGKITNSFNAKIEGKIILSKALQNGILLCTEKKAEFFALNGNSLYEAKMPVNKNNSISWTHILFSKGNKLVFFQKNWSVDAYTVIQSTNKTEELQKNSYEIKIDVSDYEYLYKNSLSEFLADEKVINELQNGNYGEKEEKLLEDLFSFCEAFKNSIKTESKNIRSENSIFLSDSSKTEKILNLIPLLSSSDSAKMISSLLDLNLNLNFKKTILKGISKNGYDPEGKIMNSLKKLILESSSKDNDFYKNICDSVLSICIFMGKPAFNTNGKEILSNLMYPKYSSEVRNYARETLKKIAKMDL